MTKASPSKVLRPTKPSRIRLGDGNDWTWKNDDERRTKHGIHNLSEVRYSTRTLDTATA